MPILVWILKIIGILLLIVIGLVLLAVLLVLFSPVRYAINAHKKVEEDVHVKVRVTWVFPLLSVVWEYKEELVTTFRILGFRIKKREREEEDQETEPTETDSKRPKKEKKDTNGEKKTEKKPKLESVEIEEKHAPLEESFDEGKAEIENRENNEECKNRADVERKEEEEKSEDIADEERKEEEEKSKKTADGEKKTEEGSTEHEGSGIFQKVKKIWDFIKEVPLCVGNLKEKCLHMLRNLKEKKSQVLQPVTKYIDFWNDKENQKGIQLLKTHGKGLLLHIWPRRWKGYLHFGLDNPASTGKALAALSILYGLVGNLPRIEPDFEKEVLEGKIQAKGRLYGFVLLKCFLKVWLNEDFKKLKVNFEKVRRK